MYYPVQPESDAPMARADLGTVNAVHHA